MGTNGDPVRCAGGILGRHRHICAFFNSLDEEHRVLGSFIKEGFDRGDKAFHIVDPELQGEHLKRLAETGIDAEQAIGTGQLELRRWQDAYLRGDRFDQDAMLALLEQVIQSGAASGYPLTRLVAPWNGRYSTSQAWTTWWNTRHASITCFPSTTIRSSAPMTCRSSAPAW